MDFTPMKKFMDGLTDWIIPGNSIVVYKDNKKVFEYSSGYQDLENKVKMQGDELLNIYSCSKVMTVCAALQLYEQGKFLLTDPLYDYMPEFRNMTVRKDGETVKAERPITIQNLFTMTAGFSYDMQSPAFKKAQELTNGRMETREVIKCLAEEPLHFEPGTKWNYSLCHDVLAGFVEAVSGQRFSEYVKENMFDCLDMNESYYHATPEIEKRIAQQYQCVVSETDLVKLQTNQCNEQGTVKNVGKGNELVPGPEYDSGGAGIITSIGDYGKFTAALANGGLGLNGNRILSENTVNLLKRNQLNEEHFKNFNWIQLKGYGYGLGVRTMMDCAAAGSNGSVGEFGWGGAAGATVLVDTDCKLAAFYSHHMLNPQETYYQPRLRNVLYNCIGR